MNLGGSFPKYNWVSSHINYLFYEGFFIENWKKKQLAKKFFFFFKQNPIPFYGSI